MNVDFYSGLLPPLDFCVTPFRKSNLRTVLLTAHFTDLLALTIICVLHSNETKKNALNFERQRKQLIGKLWNSTMNEPLKISGVLAQGQTHFPCSSGLNSLRSRYAQKKKHCWSEFFSVSLLFFSSSKQSTLALDAIPYQFFSTQTNNTNWMERSFGK